MVGGSGQKTELSEIGSRNAEKGADALRSFPAFAPPGFPAYGRQMPGLSASSSNPAIRMTYSPLMGDLWSIQYDFFTGLIGT